MKVPEDPAIARGNNASDHAMPVDVIPLPSWVPQGLAAFGIDVRRLLRAAGVPHTLFDNGKAHVSTRQFFAIWSAFEAVGAPPDFGLRVGSREPPPGQYDIATTVAMHSATFGEALAKLSRYKKLVCPEVLSVETRGAEARVQFQWLLAEVQVPAFLGDATFASLLRLLTRGTDKRIRPLRLELTRPVRHAGMLKKHFGCEIRFNSPRELMVFPKAALDEPFRTHNPDLVDLMLPGLESALRKQGAGPTWVEQVRESIVRRMRGQRPSIEAVARDLCVSSRTLQRRLEGAGTTYQQLLDNVRLDTARRLLANTDLDAGEIAFLLGFEELNSFTRAFHTWVGAPPMRWRAMRAGAPAAG